MNKGVLLRLQEKSELTNFGKRARQLKESTRMLLGYAERKFKRQKSSKNLVVQRRTTKLWRILWVVAEGTGMVQSGGVQERPHRSLQSVKGGCGEVGAGLCSQVTVIG